MFDPIMIILIVLSLFYIAYVVGEHFYYAYKRKKLKLVIHVNGIRGKSTVTRLIDAGLRGCGMSVFSKTTGTVPMTIDVSNTPKPVRRWGPANIREQMRAIDWATGQKAEVLVVECMAVNPELQYLTEHRILHSDISVITNVREDHLDEMGNDLESIAYSLANTTPKNGVVILGEDKFASCFERCAARLNSKVVKARPYEGDDLLDTFPENIAVAPEVCDVLKLDRQKFFEGMKNYIHDPGALSAYRVRDTVFINGFSANDPQSTLAIYDKVIKEYPDGEITVLLNARPDRPSRLEQHIDMLTNMVFGKLLITGSNTDYIIKKLKDKGITAVKVREPSDLLGEKVVFGCGNIASTGMEILGYFKANDRSALTAYRVGQSLLFNGFAYTDVPSALDAYQAVRERQGGDVPVLFNARPRTPSQLKRCINILADMSCGKVFVVGPFWRYVVQSLKKRGVSAVHIEKPDELLKGGAVFGCGGSSRTVNKILNYFKSNGEEIDLHAGRRNT